MAEHPILFTGSMVRAILDDRKSMTRRLAGLEQFNQQPDRWRLEGDMMAFDGGFDYVKLPRCPYGDPGDLLWVREAFWTPAADGRDYTNVIYALEHAEGKREICKHKDGRFVEGGFIGQFIKRPSIHMRRWAFRIDLRLVERRIERLHDITPDDCEAEGIEQRWTCLNPMTGSYAHDNNVVDDFHLLWDIINGDKYPWKLNPWVRVISFEKNCTE